MSIKHLWKTGLSRTSRKRADEKDIEEGGRMKGMSKKVRRGMWKKRTSVKGDVKKEMSKTLTKETTRRGVG